MPVRYYIFRHGETFATKASTGYGHRIFSASILEEGKPAIRRLGYYLKDIPTDFNISSKVKRCRQTAAIVTQESGKEFTFDRRLNEFFLEPFGRFRRRINGVIKTVEKHGYQSVCICTHGACISMLVELLTGQSYLSMKDTNYPDPGTLLIIERNKLMDQINFNDTIG